MQRVFLEHLAPVAPLRRDEDKERFIQLFGGRESLRAVVVEFYVQLAVGEGKDGLPADENGKEYRSKILHSGLGATCPCRAVLGENGGAKKDGKSMAITIIVLRKFNSTTIALENFPEL